MRRLNYSIFGLILASLAFFSMGYFHEELTYQLNIEMNAPQDKVFNHYASPDSMPQWLSGVDQLELVSGSPGKEGSIWTASIQSDKTLNNQLTLTAYQEPKIFSFHLDTGSQQVFSTAEFSTQDGKTLIQIHNKVKGNTLLWKSILYFAEDTIKQRALYDFQAFKKQVEVNIANTDQEENE